jgi:simple sugar transport system permease protein
LGGGRLRSEESRDADSNVAGRRRPRLREAVLLPALAFLLVLGALVNPHFLTYDNFVNILSASAAVGLLVVAESIIILAGSFDLSIESTLAFGPALGALLVIPAVSGGFGTEWPPLAGIALILLVGPFIGAVIGWLIVKVGLNAFVVTLAMLIVIRGLQQGITNAATLQDLPEEMQVLGYQAWLGLPWSVWLTGATFAIAWLLLKYHRLGRAIYAMGGNLEAARLSGISVDRIRIGIFALAGLLSVAAGLALVGYVGAITPNLGKDYLFNVFAATVVGGIALQGGKGSILGALGGVLLLGILQNLMVLAQVPTYWILAVYGTVILLALISTRLAAREAQAQ